jgi:hypothetical protein
MREQMFRAEDALQQARILIRGARRHIKTNPELLWAMLADTETAVADAQRHMTKAMFGAPDDMED